MNNVDLDPIKVITWFAGLMLSQQTAAYVGPYSLILLMSICGSTAALQKKSETGRYRSFFFVIWASCLAMAFTVPFSTFLASKNDAWDAQWFFMPMSFLIGYQCDRVEVLIAFGWETFKTWITLTINRGNKKDEDQK